MIEQDRGQDGGEGDPYQAIMDEFRQLLSNPDTKGAVRAAFADQIHLLSLRRDRSNTIDRIAEMPEIDTLRREKLERESNLRISELRIARMEEKIDDLSITEPRYDRARRQFDYFFDKFDNLLSQEAQQKYPERNPRDYVDEWIGETMYDMLTLIQKSE